MKMKDDPDFKKHNQRAFEVTADELRQFVEQWEELALEKADLGTQQAAVMAEAKARGYDTKAIRRIIALRKFKPDDLAEQEAVLDVYRKALGI